MTSSAPAGPLCVADEEVVDRAAARLRHETAQAQYGGLRDPHAAFGLAAVLDELAQHGHDLAALRGGHRRCTSGPPPPC